MAPIRHCINIVLCLFEGYRGREKKRKTFVDSSGPLKQSINTTKRSNPFEHVSCVAASLPRASCLVCFVTRGTCCVRMNAEQPRYMTECEMRAWRGKGEDWRQARSNSSITSFQNRIHVNAQRACSGSNKSSIIGSPTQWSPCEKCASYIHTIYEI